MRITLIIAVFLGPMMPVVARAADAPPRPNVVVILVDDMGISDIGCYGSEIQTPNLDRLGRQKPAGR